MADKQAVIGTFVKLSTMADGTPRLVLDLDCTLTQIAAFNLVPGTPVAIALITQAAAQADMREKATEPDDEYGHYYTALYMRGFFHNPRVAKAFGATMDMTPDERVEHIKQYIYVETASESLKEIPPEYFVAVCDAVGVRDTVPASILEAAAGKAI